MTQKCKTCYALEYVDPNDYSRQELRKEPFYRCWLERTGKLCQYEKKRNYDYTASFEMTEDEGKN